MGACNYIAWLAIKTRGGHLGICSNSHPDQNLCVYEFLSNLIMLPCMLIVILQIDRAYILSIALNQLATSNTYITQAI